MDRWRSRLVCLVWSHKDALSTGRASCSGRWMFEPTLLQDLCFFFLRRGGGVCYSLDLLSLNAVLMFTGTDCILVFLRLISRHAQ